MDHLSESNLNTLETIVREVCPMLNAKINQFKKRRGKLFTKRLLLNVISVSFDFIFESICHSVYFVL